MTSKTNYKVERTYLQNCGVTDVDARQPADVPVDVVDDLYEIFLQEPLWKGDGGPSFIVDDCSVLSSALARFSKTVSTVAYEITDIVGLLLDEEKGSQAATVKFQIEGELQKKLVSVAEKSNINGSNVVASVRE